MSFKKATKKQVKLKLAVQGPAGSGKTTSALILATQLGQKVALADTEKGSASLYADKYDFDVLELSEPFEPEKFIGAVKDAEKAGYDVLVIDSLSHEWQWCLETVTKLGGNSFTAWGKVTPRHDALVNAILNANIHIIACMRSKTEYILEEKNGKQVPKKAGMAPIQREGMDYEFTVVFELNQQHIANCTKDRTSLFINKDFEVTAETAEILKGWMNSGEVVAPKASKFADAETLADVKRIWDENKALQGDADFISEKDKAKQRVG